MKLSAVFALPLAVAGLLGATTIAAKADQTTAKLGGIITGEALCSLYRTGVSPEVAQAEAARITKKLLDFGHLEAGDEQTYKEMIKTVFSTCPEPSLPDA